MKSVQNLEEAMIDVHTHLGVDMHFYLRGYYPYALDWPHLMSLGEAHQIRRFVVFPLVGSMYFNLEKAKAGVLDLNGAVEKVPFAFENRRMMVEVYERFPESKSAAIPFWILDPSRLCREQVDAMRRLKEEFPCSGFKIQPTMIESPIIDLLKQGSVFLDLAAEWDIPILIHSSIEPVDHWSQCADILKVAKARSELRFCLAHSCRFHRSSLDAVAALSNTWFDCSAHRIHCELAAANQSTVAAPSERFSSDYRNSQQVLSDLARAYPDKLMWGSDAPYESYIDAEFRLCSTYALEAADLLSQGEEVIRKIAIENTRRFLGELPLVS